MTDANIDILPAWGHELSQIVMPIVVIKDNYAFPIGTATMISSLGIFITAAHNLFEALKLHANGDRLRRDHGQLAQLYKNYEIDDIAIALLYQEPASDEKLNIHFGAEVAKG